KVDGFTAGTLAAGDGVVFDEGHPEQDEQGGRVASVREARSKAAGRGRVVEVTFERGGVSLHAVSVGSIVWKTDDPAVRRRRQTSFSRDRVARRVPIRAAVTAGGGGGLVAGVHDAAWTAVPGS